MPDIDPTQPTAVVARTIRAEMVLQERKQASLAAALRLSSASVSDRLTGKTPIDINELVAIARFLGVHPGALLSRVDVEPREPALAG